MSKRKKEKGATPMLEVPQSYRLGIPLLINLSRPTYDDRQPLWQRL